MTEGEAKHVENLMRLCGMDGVAAAADPGGPSGEWRIYDSPDVDTRIDVTAEAMGRLRDVAHGRHGSTGAVRGFIMPGR